MNPCLDRRAQSFVCVICLMNLIKKIIEIPVLDSLRKKMNGLSALKIGVLDLLSNTRATEKMEESRGISAIICCYDCIGTRQ